LLRLLLVLETCSVLRLLLELKTCGQLKIWIWYGGTDKPSKRHRSSRRCRVDARHRRPDAIQKRNPTLLAGSWEKGSIVKVGFGHRRAWLSWAFALDLGALNIMRKKGFTAKEAFVIIATLVATCRIKKRK
jgi:hypothetical protein